MTRRYINQMTMQEAGRPLTISDLNRLLFENKLTGNIPVLCSADEEGNRFGLIYEATLDFEVAKLIKEFSEAGMLASHMPPIPADAKAVLTLMPAI